MIWPSMGEGKVRTSSFASIVLYFYGILWYFYGTFIRHLSLANYLFPGLDPPPPLVKLKTFTKHISEHTSQKSRPTDVRKYGSSGDYGSRPG